MKFLHTMLRVKDIEKSLEFYKNIMGLELHHTMELDDCKLYFLSDKLGYTQLELTANFEIPKNGYKIGENFGHLAFGVDNFDDFSEKIRKNNCEYLYAPFDLSGLKVAFIKDPDGNEIELIQQ